MKHRMPIIVALLAALLLALLSGGALGEDEIELGADGGEVALDIPAGDGPEWVIDGDASLDGLSVGLGEDGLELDAALLADGALVLDDVLLGEGPGEQHGAAQNAEGDIPIDKDHFPDANFRNAIIAGWWNSNQDGILSAEERAGITELNLVESGIADLRGIEYFPALTSLYCLNNRLTSLDVSGCPALTSLDCSDNQLISLNVKGLTSLSYLGCSNNQLTSLDASGLTALKNFSCTGNPLTSLNMSGCSGLTDTFFSLASKTT